MKARTPMKTPLIRTALAALTVAAALPAAAQSADFSTWQAWGDVVAGTATATLTTAAFESGEVPASGSSALLWPELEAALGTTLDGDVIEGSALGTQFTAAAGTQVALHWTLASEDFDPAFADRLVAVVDGQVQLVSQTSGALQQGSAGFTFATGGLHTLAFAVLDVNDSAGLSTVTLAGLTVTPAVPEPATAATLLLGLGALLVAARRRG